MDFNPDKDFGLNVNLDKCRVMKISQKNGKTEKMDHNNHEIKKWIIMYPGIK
jgi:hypothetical protein